MADVPATQMRRRSGAADDIAWPIRLLRKARSFFAVPYECHCHVQTDQGLEPVYDQGGPRDSDIPPPGPDVWIRKL